MTYMDPPSIDFESLGLNKEYPEPPRVDEPSYKCDSCISQGYNYEAFAPPRFGERCHICRHRCEEDPCCEGITGWERRMEKYQESLEQRALKWASENKEVVGKFFLFADKAWESGIRPIGAKLIVERMRWHHLVEAKKSESDFKLNNSYTAYLARMYLKAHPERATLFRLREVRS